MKSSYAVVVLPIVLGALGACSTAHPAIGEAPGGNPEAAPSNVRGPAQPRFGPLVHRDAPPPPINGGTLAMTPNGKTAIAADPDRDRVYIVDLASRAVTHTIALPIHSEAGRVTVDDSGHAYVVLRRAGAIATIDIATAVVTTRDVCIAPRGIVWDGAQSAIHVACANGELVTMVPGKANLTRRQAARDLRDVVVTPSGSLIMTTFRGAGSVHVTGAGLPSEPVPAFDGANLAWRALVVPPAAGPGAKCAEPDCSDTLAVVTQHPTPEPVTTAPGGYGGGARRGAVADPDLDGLCQPSRGIITTRVKVGARSVDIAEAVLPVDMATNGHELAIVAAGNAFTPELPQIFVVLVREVSVATTGGCIAMGHGNVPGQAVAAAYDSDDTLIVQTREPAALHLMTKDRTTAETTISLSTDSVADTGHEIFHANAGGFIACASCHAEGADDGHVWDFVGHGRRRTPSLLGTVAGTEPFHWDGDMKDMRDLVDHVFVERMSGPVVDPGQLGALSGWLFALPLQPKVATDRDAAARGATIFDDRCTSCHSGPKLTNNTTVDVGTGGAFQVPSLVGVGWRPLLMHDGCASTLLGRFDPKCGGGTRHGATTDLSSDQVNDLVAFLGTL